MHSSAHPDQRSRRRARRTVARTALAAALTIAGTCLPAGPAAAEDPDPLLVPWNTLLPGLSAGHDPSSSDVCRSGQLRCVDAVIREMQRRWAPLDRDCSHRAVFSLLYLRTTEAYREAARTPGFFADPGWVNHYDAVFARYYFDQEDLWRAGRTREVAPAWRTAFEAADTRGVVGLGDVLLGMNGHINRDLPFVLAEIGLVAPDGTSRKPDHDRVYEFLNAAAESQLAEVARRYDPTADDADVPGTTLDATAAFQLVQTWREVSWRNAERLVAARRLGPAAYAATAASVEAYAAAEARAIATATADLLPGTAERREAWCRTHREPL
ncbi:DUF5995 family protein [Kineococcus glutinatus]|uniref:Uncharacterized protein n=1 Tax=Kineococcus glutinatus TaxID=1070872 RepID=A0ABP9I8M4_9ACTN